jgi:hypothetical protein
VKKQKHAHAAREDATCWLRTAAEVRNMRKPVSSHSGKTAERMEIPVSMDTDMAMGTNTDMDTVMDMGTVNGKNFFGIGEISAQRAQSALCSFLQPILTFHSWKC